LLRRLAKPGCCLREILGLGQARLVQIAKANLRLSVC
jgi:hypothetical protein